MEEQTGPRLNFRLNTLNQAHLGFHTRHSSFILKARKKCVTWCSHAYCFRAVSPKLRAHWNHTAYTNWNWGCSSLILTSLQILFLEEKACHHFQYTDSKQSWSVSIRFFSEGPYGQTEPQSIHVQTHKHDKWLLFLARAAGNSEEIGVGFALRCALLCAESVYTGGDGGYWCVWVVGWTSGGVGHLQTPQPHLICSEVGCVRRD